jgi:hypothetical protein
MQQKSRGVVRPRVQAAVRRAVDYLLGRQSANGGFCFYKSQYVDEPNLSDTYHAVAALRLLGREIPRAGALLGFLRAFPAENVHALYYQAFTLDRLAPPVSPDAAQRARIRELSVTVPRDGAVRNGWLLRTLRLLRLKRRFAAAPKQPLLAVYVEHPETSHGRGDKPNLENTWLCLCIGALVSQRLPARETRVFVDGLQVPVLGFTATSDSRTATLEVIHAGLRACALLGLPLRFPADILGFVLGCQAADGGFARTPDALPDIEMTRRALQILRRLDHGN